MVSYTPATKGMARPLGHAIGEILANMADREQAIDKQEMIKALKAGASDLGIDQSAWHLITVLMSFLPGKAIGGGDAPIVFASNEAILQRAAFGSERTLRRYLNQLCEARLIVRRNSPSGKRYAVKDGEGAIIGRYGIDLSPIIARAPEIREKAAGARRARLERERCYRTASDMKHSVLRLMGQAAEEGLIGQADHAEFAAAASVRLRKDMPVDALKAAEAGIAGVYSRLHSLVEDALLPVNLSGTDGHDGRVYEESNQTLVDQEDALAARAPSGPELVEPAARGAGTSVDASGLTARRRVDPLPLSEVVRLVPDLRHYVRGGVSNWADLVAAAPALAGVLGVGQGERLKAERTFGREYAAATLALLTTRDDIANHPAYLQGLVTRATKGKFTPPSLLRHVQSRAFSQKMASIAASSLKPSEEVMRMGAVYA